MSDRAPDLTEKVIGYRSWTVGEDAELRAAVASQYAWTPGVNTAECRRGEMMARGALVRGPLPETAETAHPAPDKECGCGLYAVHDKDEALIHNPYAYGHGSTPVVGVVAAWGRMQVHCDGFRAEHVEPLAIALQPEIAVLPEFFDRAKEAAKKYGIPLVAYADLENIASEHGSPVPADLRPERPTEEYPGHLTSFGGSYVAVGTAMAPSASAFGGYSTVSGLGYTRRPGMGSYHYHRGPTYPYYTSGSFQSPARVGFSTDSMKVPIAPKSKRGRFALVVLATLALGAALGGMAGALTEPLGTAPSIIAPLLAGMLAGDIGVRLYRTWVR